MVTELTTEILALAAVVTAFVGVSKGYGIKKRDTHAIALIIAAIFVLVPANVQAALVTISLVGLTASGAYKYGKGKADE